MYKKAIMNKVRVSSSKGLLSVEKLFDLSLADLEVILKDLNSQKPKDNGDLDFITTSSGDSDLDFKFNLVKDIYLTKKQIQSDTANAKVNKAHNDKIMSIIAMKEDAELNNLSIDQLKERLK